MLKTEFLGYTLRNPLMLTEGPLSGSVESIEKAAAAGPGLVFTKGIRLEPVRSPVPYMSPRGLNLLNADWSCVGIDAWLKALPRLDAGIPVVTSVAKNYVSPETAVDMAERLVKAGSRIVSFVDYDPAQLVATVKLARPRLRVPIMVKLPPFLPRLPEWLAELVAAGVDAIAAMDSIGLGMTINVETGAPDLGSGDGSGYLSGRAILPFTLKYVYEISRAVNVPVVGVGGVADAQGALQMIMAGATGVGMATAPMLVGLRVFEDIRKGLERHLAAKGLDGIGSIRGKAAEAIASRKASNEYRARIDPLLCDNDGACKRVCYSGAIRAGIPAHEVDPAACVGCGLCAGVCHAKAISYR